MNKNEFFKKYHLEGSLAILDLMQMTIKANSVTKHCWSIENSR